MSESDHTIGPARPDELPDVRRLLERVDLPREGVGEDLTLVVARRGGVLVGCAGLEWHADGALFRSLAVDPAARGAGVGQCLTRRAMTLAAQRGHRRLYLLTETAGAFFPRLGFRPIERVAVPPGVRTSVEFTGACPDTALAMVCDLEPPDATS